MNKTNKAIAEFEDGTGNTMDIIFPKVVEQEACMNLGIAFMPFMKDKFYFLKDNSLKKYKPAGFNEIELNFVKYLYQVRYANRNKTIGFQIGTLPKVSQRIFLCGKIFPHIAIKTLARYKGKISINYSKITKKKQDNGIEYISIDEKINIYCTQLDSNMKINYVKTLFDFLTNNESEKVKLTIKCGEFPDLETYTLATGKIKLEKGCWLKSNRKSKNDIWKNACLYIVENKLQGVLAPFGQIADFYTFLDKEITKKGHKTRWLKGAKKLVGELAKWVDEGTIFIDNNIETILCELNVGICDYAITQFYEILFGKYQNNILDTNEKAYQFDLKFVKYEQGVVAVPIYAKTKKETIKDYQEIADKDNIVGLLGGITPEFDDPWEGKVTDSQFRIDLPMLMLWLDRHKPTAKSFRDKVDENGYLLEKYKEIIRPYEAQ